MLIGGGWYDEKGFRLFLSSCVGAWTDNIQGASLYGLSHIWGSVCHALRGCSRWMSWRADCGAGRRRVARMPAGALDCARRQVACIVAALFARGVSGGHLKRCSLCQKHIAPNECLCPTAWGRRAPTTDMRVGRRVGVPKCCGGGGGVLRVRPGCCDCGEGLRLHPCSLGCRALRLTHHLSLHCSGIDGHTTNLACAWSGRAGTERRLA